MADNSVNDLLSLINQQIDSQEDLRECLSKAEALSITALNRDFQECSEEVQHYHLSALNDLITNSKILNEKSLEFLFSYKKSTMGDNFNKLDEKSNE